MTKRAARLATSLTILTVLGLAGTPLYAERADWVRKESFKLLNEGVAAFNRADYKAAVEKLEKCASMSLNSFRAHYFLGLALTGDRRHADAVEILKIALDLDPTHLQAHVALGDAFLNQGDMGEASAEYHRALKLRPEFPPALDGIARVYESRAAYEKAISYFRRAIASNRGYANAYTHLGDLYLRKGELDEAVRLLVEAVSIRPDFGPGLNRLALAYSRLGLHNEAVSTIQKAITIEPHSPNHRATLGRIQLELGLLTSAEQSLREALEIDSAHPVAREALAEIARRRGEYEAALSMLDEALADERLSSLTSRRIEERRRVIQEEYERFVELEIRVAWDEAGPADYRSLARIYAERRLWDTAVAYQALSEPVGPERERLAYFFFRAGRYREAHEIYRELAGGTPSPDMEVNSGVALARLGDDPGAIQAYRRALSLSPDHLLAHLYLGNSLVRLGRKEDGVASYKLYLEKGGSGEAAERARRILEQIAPEALPKDATGEEESSQ